MATTSLWRVGGRLGGVLLYAENPEKTTEVKAVNPPKDVDINALGDVIAYASREDATNVRQFVSGVNCDPKTARNEMLAVKQMFEKEGGTIAYHGYQSFAEGEVTPEQAHEIGVKLATELWGDKFQVLVATHLDKESHLHNHFVINTVSFIDGKKFYRSESDYRKMREVSDRLCREYGLSVIEDPTRKGRHYSEWLAEHNGQPTIRSQIRADVDRAAAASFTETEFLSLLEEMGYKVKVLGSSGKPLKHPALKPPGAKNYFRFDGLGKGYSLDVLLERVGSNTKRQVPFSEAEIAAAGQYRRKHVPKPKLKGLYALYIRYCFELGIIKKYPASRKRVSMNMREDIAKLEKLNAQTRFLGRHGIETFEDLDRFRNEAKDKLAGLDHTRNHLKNELKKALRTEDASLAEQLRIQISEISKDMKELRKDLSLCDAVEERSERVAAELAAIEKDQAEKEGREEKPYEQLLR